jgi:hypothetical protein
MNVRGASKGTGNEALVVCYTPRIPTRQLTNLIKFMRWPHAYLSTNQEHEVRPKVGSSVPNEISIGTMAFALHDGKGLTSQILLGMALSLKNEGISPPGADRVAILACEVEAR